MGIVPTHTRRQVLEGWINPKLRPKLPYRGPARSLAASPDELRALVAACRTGRLSDVAAWVEAGRPLQIDPCARPGRPRVTPLAVAIETGQHDLVYLLLAAGYRPELEPQSPLDHVLRDRRWDLLDLLLEGGADPQVVDVDDVLGTYSREVMERFWDLGVYLAGDGAMAATLATQTRNRALYGFVKNHTHDPRIQREVDLGLGYALSRRNEKAVSMCLWAGANPRHSVPVMGDGIACSDDWRMTAFERAVWEGAPEYLGRLGFDHRADEVEPLYEVAYHASEIEALVAIKPPRDWHPITERFVDRAVTAIDLVPHAQWRAKSDLAAVLRLGGRLRTLSDLLKRRLRKHLRDHERGQATRFLRLLEKHTDQAAFLDLIAHPMFIEDYRAWGLKKGRIEEIADGSGGSRAASAKARSVLKKERDRPPKPRVPWDTEAYVRMKRHELHELVWSEPMIRASKRYGLSDNGLRRICKQLDVPVPPRGYWAKGQDRGRAIPLAPVKKGWPIEAWLPRTPQQQRPAKPHGG